MSEKIVQLNEEIIKGQIKELVRGSVEEALIEMYLAGVSVPRMEEITEALWGSKVSPATISELNKKAYVHIEDWRNRPLQGGRYPYVSSSATSAWGCWRPWARCFRTPNTSAARCISIAMFSLLCLNPRSKLWQKCSRRSTPKRAKKASRDKTKAVVAELRAMKLKEAAKKVEDGIEETLIYCDFPSEHWTLIRTNNVIERLNREIRRRTRVVGTFPDGNSALMLVCAWLRHVAGTQWGSKKYMNMKHLEAALDDASIAG